MKPERSYVIWVPRNGSGRIRNFLIGPSFIKILSLLLFFCICAVPVMETGILTLNRRVTDLERKRQQLQAEVQSLQYIKKALACIEKKDRMVRGYFGMERFRSLEQIVGTGGTPDMELSSLDFNHTEIDSKPHVTRMTVPMKLQVLKSNYEILDQLLAKKEEALDYTPNIIPVDMEEPRISSGFGWRKSPFTKRREFHAGIDIRGPRGTKILAPASGVVINRGYDQWIGNYLVVQHTKEIKTIYGHLSRISVDKGIKVRRGDPLGLMGNTGLSTGSHLHYAVIRNGRAVNPMEYILDMRGG